MKRLPVTAAGTSRKTWTKDDPMGTSSSSIRFVRGPPGMAVRYCWTIIFLLTSASYLEQVICDDSCTATHRHQSVRDLFYPTAKGIPTIPIPGDGYTPCVQTHMVDLCL